MCKTNKVTPPLPVLRLNNLYAKAPALAKVAGMVDASHHDYFVRHLLAGEHGSVQAILSHFWFKFYHHCKEIAQLPPVWNIDNKNPQRLAEILSHLNFQDTSTLETTISLLQHELSHLQSVRPRRSNPRAPKPKVKPLPSNSKPRGTRSGRVKVQDTGSSAEGSERSGNKQAEGKTSEETRRESTELV